MADRVVRKHTKLAVNGATVAITTASAATARDINRAMQHRQGNWRHGPAVRLRGATCAYVGDRVATRRNEKNFVATSGRSVRNRQTWTVTAVHSDGGLTVDNDAQGEANLPGPYVARHVELGWAVTGYGNQGDTVDHGICIVEPATSRAGLYVGMTRGRATNAALVIDPTGTADPSDTLVAIVQRPANGITAHAMRDRLHGHPVPDMPDDAERMRRRLHQTRQHPTPARTLRRG